MTGPIANPPATPDRTDPARASGRSAKPGDTAGDGLAGLLGASFYSFYQSELGTRAAGGSSLVGSSREATFRAEPSEASVPIDHSRRTPGRAGAEPADAPRRDGRSRDRSDAAPPRAETQGRTANNSMMSGTAAKEATDAGSPGRASAGAEASSTPRAEPAPGAPAAAIAAPISARSVAGSSGSGGALQGVQSVAGARSGGGGPLPVAGVGERGVAARGPGASIARPIATPQRQEPPNLIAQAVRGLAAALRQRNGTVTMRLAPESLGPLRVRLSVHDSQVTAEFRAESSQARDLLSQSTAQLRSAIEARGLTVHRIEVLGPEGDAERSPGDAGGGEPRDGRGGDESAADRSASERRSGFARSESGPGDAEAFVGGSLELASDGRWIALGRLDTLA